MIVESFLRYIFSNLLPFSHSGAVLFQDLTAFDSDDELLSLLWVWKLLDTFLGCQEEFRVILFNHRIDVDGSLFDRMIA